MLAGGERRPGGTALYSALQAARLGLVATIVTRGREDELQELLRPFSDELELIVQPAPATTTLQTTGSGEQRRQRMLAWAGPIAPGPLPQATILHLAPVADELTVAPAGRWPFVGLTPQGLARRWDGPGGEVLAREPSERAMGLFEGPDAIVLSREERELCEAGIERARRRGSLVAVTAGPAETLLLAAEGGPLQIAAPPVAGPVDDLGAGDVYAAALFVALAGGSTPARAGRLAGAAASLRVAGAGPGAIAGRAEIEAQAASAASSSSVSSAAPS